MRAHGGELRGAVAVVQVHVEHGGGANFAGGVQRIERDDEAVEGAETFAVIRAGVVKSADHRGGNAVAQSLPRRRETAATGQADRGIKLGRPRKFLRLRERTRRAGLDRADVFRRMHALQIFRRHRRGLGEPYVRGLAQGVGDEREFPNRHEVLAERRGVAGMVKRGQHCVGGSSAMTASSGGSWSGESSGCARSAGRNCGA